MYKQLAIIYMFLLSCSSNNTTIVVDNSNGERTVSTMCWFRQQCADNVAEVCQEGFVIEHDYGLNMIAKCVR